MDKFMNLLPIFVPPEHLEEASNLSKNDLLDMVWDFCMQNNITNPLKEFRSHRDMVVGYRIRHNQETMGAIDAMISAASERVPNVWSKL